jgi:hypothetical protein
MKLKESATKFGSLSEKLGKLRKHAVVLAAMSRASPELRLVIWTLLGERSMRIYR